MAITDTYAATSFGAALSATGATAGLAINGDNEGRAVEAAVIVVASTVTSGATLQIERKGDGDGWIPVAKIAIAATGTYAIPSWARKGRGPNGKDVTIRVNCLSYTDGSYACSIARLTKG